MKKMFESAGLNSSSPSKAFQDYRVIANSINEHFFKNMQLVIADIIDKHNIDISPEEYHKIKFNVAGEMHPGEDGFYLAMPSESLKKLVEVLGTKGLEVVNTEGPSLSTIDTQRRSQVMPEEKMQKRPNIRAQDPRAVLDAIHQKNPGRTIPKPTEEAKSKAQRASSEAPSLLVENIQILEGVPKQAAQPGSMIQQEAVKMDRGKSVPKSQEAQIRADRGIQEERQNIPSNMVKALIKMFEKKEPKASENSQTAALAQLDKILEARQVGSKENSPALNPLDIGSSNHFTPQQVSGKSKEQQKNPSHSDTEPQIQNSNEKKSGNKPKK